MRGLNILFPLFSFACTSFSFANDFVSLWEMDMSQDNFGFTYKGGSIIANESNTAVGTTANATSSTIGVTLDYSPIGGFEWGKTILNVSGEVDFTASEGSSLTAQWFGFAFTNAPTTGANEGYPFAWLSGDGNLRISVSGSGNQQGSSQDPDMSAKDNALKVSYEGTKLYFDYTYDTTKDDTFMEVSFVFRDENGDEICSKTGLLNAKGVDISGNSFKSLSFTFMGNNQNQLIDGWLYDLKVSGVNIPEPAHYVIVSCLAALGFAFMRRRRR